MNTVILPSVYQKQGECIYVGMYEIDGERESTPFPYAYPFKKQPPQSIYQKTYLRPLHKAQNATTTCIAPPVTDNLKARYKEPINLTPILSNAHMQGADSKST